MGSLSHTPIQSISKFYPFYFQNISRIQMLYIISTAVTLIQATIVSSLDYCNSLSLGLPVYSLAPVLSLPIAAV